MSWRSGAFAFATGMVPLKKESIKNIPGATAIESQTSPEQAPTPLLTA